MIPKLIHTVWISNNDNEDNKFVKDDIKNNILSTSNNSLDILRNNGYEIRIYNEKNFDMSISNYLLQAYSLKKYAFVSDYIRFYELYHYGGIWLDSDVECYKTFDELLNLKYFYTYNYPLGLTTNRNAYDENLLPYDIDVAIIGVEKHNKIIKAILDYYDSVDFIQSDYFILNKFKLTSNSVFLSILNNLNIKQHLVSSNLDDYNKLVSNSNDNEEIYILNTKWMTNWYYHNEKNNYDEDVICVHRRAGSWLTDDKDYLYEYSDEEILEYFKTYKNLKKE